MKYGHFGQLFDLDHDGKLSPLEAALDFAIFEEEEDQEDD